MTYKLGCAGCTSLSAEEITLKIGEAILPQRRSHLASHRPSHQGGTMWRGTQPANQSVCVRCFCFVEIVLELFPPLPDNSNWPFFVGIGLAAAAGCTRTCCTRPGMSTMSSWSVTQTWGAMAYLQVPGIRS